MKKKIYPYPDITIIVIFFLQYRYIGDSFKPIAWYNDVILPVPWYIVLSRFHFIPERVRLPESWLYPEQSGAY